MAERDHASRASVSTAGYAHLTARMRDRAADTDTPLAFVLKGGYQVKALAENVRRVQVTISGRHPAEPEPVDPVDPGVATQLDGVDVPAAVA